MATHTKDHVLKVIDACIYAAKENNVEKVRPMRLGNSLGRGSFFEEDLEEVS